MGGYRSRHVACTRLWLSRCPGPCRRGFAALPPAAWPQFPQLQQALEVYKAKNWAEATRPDAQQLGPTQMQWVRHLTKQSLVRNTKWQLYGTVTVLQDQ